MSDPQGRALIELRLAAKVVVAGLNRLRRKARLSFWGHPIRMPEESQLQPLLL